MSYKETLNRINAQKKRRIRERQMDEIRTTVLKPVRENVGVALGVTVLTTVGLASLGHNVVYADTEVVTTNETTSNTPNSDTENTSTANSDITTSETKTTSDKDKVVYTKQANVVSKEVVDTEKTNVTPVATAGVTNDLTDVTDYAIKGTDAIKKMLVDNVTEIKSVMTDAEYKALLWEKEQSYCLKQKVNVFDNWRTLRGKGISNSKTRTYMSYKAVTATYTTNYKVLNSRKAWNNASTGLRMYEDRYCVAVGLKYGRAGDKIDLVMEDGTVVKAIIGDSKAKKDTDETMMFQRHDGSIVELITDGTKFRREKVPAVLRQHITRIVNLKGVTFE